MSGRFGVLFRKHGFALAVLAAVWLLSVIIVNPSGNFPLNDDWNYARTVKGVLDEHQFVVTQWSLAASLTHVLIGVFACVPCGFSFDALRVSTIFLGCVAMFSVYAVCVRIGAARSLAVFAALLLGLNPLFFNLSLTYMTDVPFLALAALSLLAAYPLFSSKERHPLKLSIACFTLVAACLLRQTGLVLPIALACVSLRCGGEEKDPASEDDSVHPEERRLGGIFVGLLPLVLSISAVWLFQTWLSHTAGTLYSYRAEEAYLRQRFSMGFLLVFLSTAQNLIEALVYLGLFAMPLIPLVFRDFLKTLGRSEKFFALALAAECGLLLAGGLIFTGSSMPMLDNLFFNFGVGPLLVAFDQNGVAWPNASPMIMKGLGLLGALAAGFLVSIFVVSLMRVAKKQRLLADEQAQRLLFFCMTAYVLYLTCICLRGMFDRYLLFPFLLLIPLMVAAPRFLPAEQSVGLPVEVGGRRAAWIIACALLLPSLWVSVGCAHDYLSWNRARWRALNELTEKAHISAMDIDGGLEFNGWYSYDPRYKATGVIFSTSMKHNDLYAVTLKPMDGYSVEHRYSFQRWVPMGTGEILVLKKVLRPLNSH